jgi:hypothetical protein
MEENETFLEVLGLKGNLEKKLKVLDQAQASRCSAIECTTPRLECTSTQAKEQAQHAFARTKSWLECINS